MGTDCTPFLANLFLFVYEWKWLTKKLKEKGFECLERFNACFRYIDALLCLNNDQMMDDVMTEITPSLVMELESRYISRSGFRNS